MIIDTEFRIVQYDLNDFRIELRRLETILWWKSWTDWERVGIKHYYEYHTKHQEYTWETEDDARAYVAELKAETAKKRERDSMFPKIIHI